MTPVNRNSVQQVIAISLTLKVLQNELTCLKMNQDQRRGLDRPSP